MFLSEKTQKACHLLISMQKQPFLLKYLKTLSGGPLEDKSGDHTRAGSGLDNLYIID